MLMSVAGVRADSGMAGLACLPVLWFGDFKLHRIARRMSAVK
jgi:hypothetical protein